MQPRRSDHGALDVSGTVLLRLLLLLGGSLTWLVASAAQLQLESVLGNAAGADERGTFARAEVVRPFVFPGDHGPHEGFRSEWWYLTMSLENAAGELFGVQFTAFRQALRAPVGVPAGTASAAGSAGSSPGPWDPDQLYLAHLAVTDVTRNVHLQAERLTRAHPELAGAQADPFRVWVDGWSLSALEEPLNNPFSLHPFVLQGRSEDFEVQISLRPGKDLVLQGDRGLSRKGPEQASYYYSMTRIAAQGTLRVGERTHRVQGEAWLDREWSTSLLSSRQKGWDWFGLQLAGGEELMVFQLRRDDQSRDPFDQGLWVDPEGGSRWLKAEDFDLQPLRYWRDDAGVAWPVEWRLDVRLPVGRRQYRIEAAVQDQRMDTLLTYWEGLVQVWDGADRIAGRGYMELTGYE